MPELNLNVRIYCECGNELRAKVQITLDSDGCQVMTVASCDRCLQDEE